HLASARRIEPRRADAQADERGRLLEIALGGRTAAALRLLSEHRRWWRVHRDLSGTRTRPAPAAGADSRRRAVAFLGDDSSRTPQWGALGRKKGGGIDLRHGWRHSPGHRRRAVLRRVHATGDPRPGGLRLLST